jgi:TraX protein
MQIALNSTHQRIIGVKPMTEAIRTAAEPLSPVAPPLSIANGTLEALKWLAVVLMVVDHVNKYLYHGKIGWMFAAGRLVMPVFAFVLAYNLARPETLASGGFARTAKRLLVYGLVATVPYTALNGLNAYGWPLNVLFTLLVATLVIWLYEAGSPRQGMWLIPLFSFGSMLPEYWILGTGMTIAAYFYCKSPRPLYLGLWLLSVTLLGLLNMSLYALLAVPLLYFAPKVNLTVPRLKYFFYAFYPAHFALLWIIKMWRT